MRHRLPALASLLAACTTSEPPVAQIHDNNIPAGTRTGDTVSVALRPVQAMWYPETSDDPGALVWAIAADGGAAMIPGPLLRGNGSTVFRVTVENPRSDSTLQVIGLGTRPGGVDGISIAPGRDTTIIFAAGAPGTYFYAFAWGSDDEDLVPPDEALLAGALIVDGPGDPDDDQVFVASSWHVPVDSSVGAPFVPKDWFVINGRSFPHNKLIEAQQGDTLHWRWINASHDAHPIHLHGDHFVVTRRGSLVADSATWEQEVVTELMLPGGTFAARYIPQEPGNWALHCHFAYHTSHFLSTEQVPEPTDPGSPLSVDHSVHGMRGMLMRIRIKPRVGAARRVDQAVGARKIRMLAVARDSVYSGNIEGFRYLLPELDQPLDSFPIISPVLVLNRGEPVEITVVNRLRAPTAVHWHGMELPSRSDGVPGWSGGLPDIVPAIEPGDSFVARFTPPRAGTYIYHAHSNELHQIDGGLFGALLVVDPATWQPELERLIVVGGNGYQTGTVTVNGKEQPDPISVPENVPIRLRMVDIQADYRIEIGLLLDGDPVAWTPLAKDGAELPIERQIPTTSGWLSGPGETADFEINLPRGEYLLMVRQYANEWQLPVTVYVHPDPGAS